MGLGHVVGPISPDALPRVHVSQFGVIPKSHRLGNWRLIMDLSHPTGVSVNDGIESELCTLRYMLVDEAIKWIRSRGWRTLMAKLDIESAYRSIPVHPMDRFLLGVVWKGELYMYLNSALLFGLQLAP